MSKYTPGPWEIDEPSYSCILTSVGRRDNNSPIVVELWSQISGSETEANARLIAAAPELLEATMAIAQKLAGYPDDADLDKNLIANDSVTPVNLDWRDVVALRAAIAKATL